MIFDLLGNIFPGFLNLAEQETLCHKLEFLGIDLNAIAVGISVNIQE